jgi:hypothetical protein
VTAPDPLDVALIDRAERYGDELDRSKHRLAVTVLILVGLALVAAVVLVVVAKANSPFAPPPDDRPAVAYRTDEVQIPAVLRVHGHSALVTS